jgi:AcrR family transcriptional regulator
MRKTPKQARAGQTVATLLEAAAQLLQAEGEAGFSTNRVAARAGFSIGTLYQYFPNKDAIIAALAERERDAIVARIRAALAEPAEPEEAVRRIIRILVAAFAGRRRVRRFVLLAVLRGSRLGALHAAQQSIVAAVVDGMHGRAQGPPLPPARRFVLTRAVMGAIRAAVLEESDLLETTEFEDELVRLVLALLRSPLAPAAAPQ